MNLTLATDDIIIWYCFGIEIHTGISLDLVVQFCWNFVSETFSMIAILRSTLDWINTTHTQKYQIILEVIC